MGLLIISDHTRHNPTSEPLHCFFYLAPSLQSHVAHPLAFKYLLKCQLLNHIYPDQYIYNRSLGGPIVVQWKWIWLISMRMQVQSLASLSGFRTQCCHELWCRSQTRLTSCVSLAVAAAMALILTPSLGTSICHERSPKKETQMLLYQCSLSWRVFSSHSTYLF